ncbi:RebB family R body protein [Ramlibacter sp. WS9]|uniref:RebB family R body protein n=1 Tax=Ramlibacter sp. WS9 TaxID=1882741 RepID=UPI0011432FA0|nr:RebB family R body protein [Ramlibacter sp. WS9]ROZ74907.1 hypothetical protein EEB15_16075 [Ramlibacter sp. WS9]
MSDVNGNGNSAATGLVNSQAVEAIQQVLQLIGDGRHPFAAAAASQTMAHALGIALQNAVTNQQHCHMLRNAMATAAAKAVLEGRTEVAGEMFRLAGSPLMNPTLDVELAQLRAALAELPAPPETPGSTAAPRAA